MNGFFLEKSSSLPLKYEYTTVKNIPKQMLNDRNPYISHCILLIAASVAIEKSAPPTFFMLNTIMYGNLALNLIL